MDILLGDKIAILRQRHGMSKKELAERANVSVETISKYENNLIKNPDNNVIAAIATAFDMTANNLLRGFDDYSNDLPTEPLIKKEDNAKEQNPLD